MNCPKCGSENVRIDMIQSSAKSKHKGNGFRGIILNLLRLLIAVCTCGLSLLVWKKSKGDTKTKIKNEKVCICQSCGNSWKIK
ncbi:MAG: hypothetical protein MJZ20_13330 [Bacteroidaceae bacterium]|nr:hypothetical protein [Bacteroidaceae bacterium]